MELSPDPEAHISSSIEARESTASECPFIEAMFIPEPAM
jgi:hypothetical protein